MPEKAHAPARALRGIEPERVLWMMKRWRRVVQWPKSEMQKHRVFGRHKRTGESQLPTAFRHFGVQNGTPLIGSD